MGKNWSEKYLITNFWKKFDNGFETLKKDQKWMWKFGEKNSKWKF